MMGQSSQRRCALLVIGDVMRRSVLCACGRIRPPPLLVVLESLLSTMVWTLVPAVNGTCACARCQRYRALVAYSNKSCWPCCGLSEWGTIIAIVIDTDVNPLPRTLVEAGMSPRDKILVHIGRWGNFPSFLMSVQDI